MNHTRSRKITGVDGFNGTVSLTRADKTHYTRASNLLRIDALGDEHFEIHIPPEEFSADLVERIIAAFRFHPEWRENFRVFSKPHAALPLKYPSGKIGSVDTRLQPYVQELNDRGFPTFMCCEGDQHPMGRLPFIRFVESIPHDLESVWNSLDWLNLDRTVTPLRIRGHSDALSDVFFLILDDWLFNDLDVTAARYRLTRVATPPIPAMPAPSTKQLNDHGLRVTKKAQRLNRKGATSTTFDDLVKLRSGRDRYSNMKLPALLGALEGDPEVAHIQRAIFSVPDLQRALRWRLRGLTLEMILKKHEVDLILSRHREKMRSHKIYE